MLYIKFLSSIFVEDSSQKIIFIKFIFIILFQNINCIIYNFISIDISDKLKYNSPGTGLNFLFHIYLSLIAFFIIYIRSISLMIIII